MFSVIIFLLLIMALIYFKRELDSIKIRLKKLEEQYCPEQSSKKMTEQTAVMTEADKKEAPYPKVHKEARKIFEPEENIELSIGKLFNRLGVVAVVIGIAIFLKYSFDNNWIGPTGRIIIGILAGLAMWGGGEYTRKKYPVYAQGLLGGGSLVIFLSLYAGYDFYDLYSQVAAFCALVIIMLFTVVMALRYDSLAVGILGIIGGYTTPFLVGSSDPAPWVLFSYLTVLTSGVLIVSSYRKWPVFNYLSFLFNQTVIAFWMLAVYRASFLVPTYLFLVIIFVLYLGISSIYNIKNNKPSTYLEILLVFLNCFLFFLWSTQTLEYTFFKDYIGYYAVLLAVIYTIIGRAALKLYDKDKKQVIALFGVALVLITLAIPIQLEDQLIAFFWIAEAFGLVFLGLRVNSKELRYSGLAIFVLGLIISIDDIEYIRSSEPFLLNRETLLMFFGLLITGLLAKFYKNKNGLGKIEKDLSSILTGLFIVEIFIILSIENGHFFNHTNIQFFLNPEQLSLSFLWLVYAVILFALGLTKNNRYLRYSGLGLMAVVLGKAFLIDLAMLATVYKIILLIIVGLCLLGVSFVYQKKKDYFLQQQSERG